MPELRGFCSLPLSHSAQYAAGAAIAPLDLMFVGLRLNRNLHRYGKVNVVVVPNVPGDWKITSQTSFEYIKLHPTP